MILHRGEKCFHEQPRPFSMGPSRSLGLCHRCGPLRKKIERLWRLPAFRMVATIVEIERKPVVKRSSLRSLASFHMMLTTTQLFLEAIIAIMLKPASHLRFQGLTSRSRRRRKRETLGTSFTALMGSKTRDSEKVSANFRVFVRVVIQIFCTHTMKSA